MTYQNHEQWLEELRSTVREVTPRDVAALCDCQPGVALLDVRDESEIASEGCIPGSVHVPRALLEFRVEDVIPKYQQVVVYCAGGHRSLLASESLTRLGYADVSSLAGGFRRWASQGYPVVRPRVLSASDRNRYSRHLLIPEVGVAGQRKLLDSKVLLIGAGGIGSPVAYYLAAVGVGTLTIMDFDKVEESNLQRQILHRADRVGHSKARSARETLLALNPAIQVEAIEDRLDCRNAEATFLAHDLIIDGSDNFPTRYLVNDVAVLTSKPVVHGSVARFEGQVTIFDPPRGPCYRCLYPAPPPPELAPSCAEAGVLGVLPGVVGLLVAVEAIKLILSLGEPLTGKLLVYDALTAQFRRLKTKRNPACSYCGDGVKHQVLTEMAYACASNSKALESS